MSNNLTENLGPVERDPEVLAKIETVPLSCPACDVDHGDYLDVKPEPDGPTKARSEDFVSTFLTRSPGPAWPARRGHPQPAHP